MTRRVHGRRRPPVRNPSEPRGPGHARPTVHPTPASQSDKPCGGVMCVPAQQREAGR